MQAALTGCTCINFMNYCDFTLNARRGQILLPAIWHLQKMYLQHEPLGIQKYNFGGPRPRGWTRTWMRQRAVGRNHRQMTGKIRLAKRRSVKYNHERISKGRERKCKNWSTQAKGGNRTMARRNVGKPIVIDVSTIHRIEASHLLRF